MDLKLLISRAEKEVEALVVVRDLSLKSILNSVQAIIQKQSELPPDPATDERIASLLKLVGRLT